MIRLKRIGSNIERTAPRLLAGIAISAAISVTAFSAQAAIIAETVSPFNDVLNPGQTYSIKYKFSSTGATSAAHKVFLHVIDSNGVIKLQDDHYPQTPTTQWFDVNVSPIPDISYVRPLTIPSNFAAGDYKVVVGLYNGNNRLQLIPGQRVTEYCAGCKSYLVANLTVTTRQVISANFTCNDIYTDPQTWTDNTNNIRSFFTSITSGNSQSTAPIYKLPLGGCKYATNDSNGGNLKIWGKSNFEIVGRGIPDTILYAGNRLQSSIILSSTSNAAIRHLSISTQRVPGDRIWDGASSRGIYVEDSSGTAVRNTQISNVASAGMVFYNSSNSTIDSNEIIQTEADGIQITGTSSDTLINKNWAHETGDDSYSSIGYGTNLVQRTTITNNYSGFSKASGIAIEGTDTATVQWNEVKYSEVSGIRIASIAYWSSGQVSNVVASNNHLQEVRTRCNIDAEHAAVMIFADYANVSNVQFTNNTISNPRTWDGIRVRGATDGSSDPTASSITINNNALTSTGQNASCQYYGTNLTQCLSVGPNTSGITATGNTWKINGTSQYCNNL